MIVHFGGNLIIFHEKTLYYLLFYSFFIILHSKYKSKVIVTLGKAFDICQDFLERIQTLLGECLFILHVYKQKIGLLLTKWNISSRIKSIST